jgi:hypothetical protein
MSATTSRAQWRQAGLLTLGAAGLWLGIHLLRGRPALTHMDFVAGGPGALEFCNAADPRFLPVVTRSSPVVMTVQAQVSALAGDPVRAVLILRTNTGKSIGPKDLQPTATQLMNLLIVDPALADFHAVQPEPGAQVGEWRFVFTPNRAGAYRIFADFTPRATAAEMYASADLVVTAKPGVEIPAARPPATGVVESGGLRCTLLPARSLVRAREPVELNLAVRRLDGGLVSLQPIDGTRARLVAFDQDRTGFVSLSADPDAAASLEGRQPHLAFRVTIPDPGQYFIWSRINDGRTEVAGPFSLEVMP